MTSDNIRFTINDDDYIQTIQYTGTEILQMMMELFAETDPINVVLETSNEDVALQSTNTKILVESQKYSLMNRTDDTCSICMRDLEADNDATILSCRHVFHNKCVLEWGRYKAECPNCKAPIPTQ